ncbi:MAG: putative Ig domain-containing protein, partial [Kiritimatiellae bacterium]|nr:putative Ig domain-containing protein [Kiritimatiellia bacterium]
PDAKKGWPAVFEDRVLVAHSEEGDDIHAYRDPGAIVGTGELNLGSGASGTVTVSPKYGQVAAGKPVTLTAKADTGSVFSCWEIVGVDTTGLDLSSPTLKYPSPASGDVTATAKFVTKQEDIDSLVVTVSDGAAESDGSYALDLGACVDSYSLPKLTVTGLPAGLKYDAKTMTISGKATKPGVYTVTVKATNASVKTATAATTKTFRITVPNLSCDALPNLNPETDFYVASVGVAISANFINCTPTSGWTVNVAGLPTGLKYDAKTGKITGVLTAKVGLYTVTFTATKRGEPNQMATITLNVEPLPDWAVGTFYGYLYTKGYSGSGVGRTSYVTWECADLVTIDVSSVGVVKFTGTFYDNGGRIDKDYRTATLTHFDRANERIDFEWSYTERDGGPVTGIDRQVASGAIYRNAELSEKLGADIAEIEIECNGTDGWNDDYEAVCLAQKNVFSMSSLGAVLPDVNGKSWTDNLYNVYSTESWSYVSGRLDLLFAADGVFSPVWTPAGAGSMTRKLAQKTYLILDDFDTGTGVATCQAFVSTYDNVDEERACWFLYTLQISAKGEVLNGKCERVLIDEDD